MAKKKKTKKLNKEEFNLKALKQQGREINMNAHIVAPASVQKSKKVYSRKRKHKNMDY